MNKFGNPTLAYLHRRWLARQLVRAISPGRFLEIGIGSGYFYQDLLNRGFHGVGLDLNSDIISEHENSNLQFSGAIEFRSTDFFLIREQFDLVIAFEVLEHYEQDLACLEKWKELLLPGGTLIFSVPAHRRQWTVNDSSAGHARRYEKVELIEKLSRVRLFLEEIWCYGYPLLNLTYPLSSLFRLSKGASDPMALKPGNVGPENLSLESLESRPLSSALMTNYRNTYDSGTRQFSSFGRFLLVEELWWPFLELQRLWLTKDRGTGFMVKCRRESRE